MVLATDGTQSFAVFTYKCGELNWSYFRASIGFSASSSVFANHHLSRLLNVNDIACLESPSPPWSNVVYQIDEQITGMKLNYVCYSMHLHEFKFNNTNNCEEVDNDFLNNKYGFAIANLNFRLSCFYCTGCGAPGLPLLGRDGLRLSYTNTTINSIAEYSCDTGYILIGNSTRMCQQNGNWSGHAPLCRNE